MTDYLYRVQILDQPEWEMRECETFAPFEPGSSEGIWTVDELPCPVGWEPSEEYIKRFQTTAWVAPSTEKMWRSRSSAAMRRDILEAAGFHCIIQRSAPVQWPAEGQERIEESVASQILDAMAVLSREGLVTADELLRGRKQRP